MQTSKRILIRALAAWLLLAAQIVAPATAAAQQAEWWASNSSGVTHSYTVTSSCASTGNGSGGTNSCTLTIHANKLLVAAGWFYGVGTDSITDSQSLTWTTLANCNVFRSGPNNDFMKLAYVYTGSNSGSDTVTTTAAGGFTAVSVAEYDTGLSGGTDGTTCSSGTSSGSGTISSGNITTTNAGDLVVGIAASDEGMGTSLTAGSGYSLSLSNNTIDSSLGYFMAIEDRLGTTAGTYAATFNQGGAGPWIVDVAAFPTSH